MSSSNLCGKSPRANGFNLILCPLRITTDMVLSSFFIPSMSYTLDIAHAESCGNSSFGVILKLTDNSLITAAAFVLIRAVGPVYISSKSKLQRCPKSGEFHGCVSLYNINSKRVRILLTLRAASGFPPRLPTLFTYPPGRTLYSIAREYGPHLSFTKANCLQTSLTQFVCAWAFWVRMYAHSRTYLSIIRWYSVICFTSNFDM